VSIDRGSLRLSDYLANGEKDWARIQADGRKAGHTKDTLRRAKDRLGVVSRTEGFPRHAFWRLPLDAKAPGQPTNAPSAPSAFTGESCQRDIYPTSSLDALGAVVAAPGVVASGDAHWAKSDALFKKGWP